MVSSISIEDELFHTFPRISNPKMNVRVPLEFDFVYYVIAVHHVSHYALGTPSTQKWNPKK